MSRGKSTSMLFLIVPLVSASYPVYTAVLSELSSSGVSGSVSIFGTSGMLLGVGMATGLEADLSSNNCTVTNACGTHVHVGTSCASTSTQGGHYGDDPFAGKMYTSTTAAGAADFSFTVNTSQLDASGISGRVFIIHDSTGGRVACGILNDVSSSSYSVTTAELSGSGVTGTVTLQASDETVMGAGEISGLTASLSASDCSATNLACGLHVHSGTSCSNPGGFYVGSGGGDWADARYTSTDSSGEAYFTFSVNSNATEVAGKTFVIHGSDQSMVSCGIIAEVTTTTTTTSQGTVGIASQAVSLGARCAGAVVMATVFAAIQ